MKNWQVYTKPSIIKGEQVAYSFTNAKLRKNENGTISVYYYGDQELQNDKASAEVDPSLMARAQRTLAKEIGDSIDSGETPANFIIPKPYYINASGDTVTLDWRLSMDGKDISIDFTPDTTEYPLALDPTLSFTAPAMSNTGDVITGESAGGFGYSMTTGDFNSDGKMDLAVGASVYAGSSTHDVYIFYSDGIISTTAVNADVIIRAGSSSEFGCMLTSGDFNADGRIDLAVTACRSGGNWTGVVYIFYNDGSIPTTDATADVTITGEATFNHFGWALTANDFNFDGKTDLAVGAEGAEKAYIFYNDGSYPSAAASADVIISSESASNSFGHALTSGDFNSDGRTDLAVGAEQYGSYAGRAYIFYNDGSYPATAASADIIFTGGSGNVGGSLASGDFNADGRTDLAVGAYGYSSSTGRAYIFYNDGSIPTTIGTADVTITGETTNNYFGASMTAGDFNVDGRADLVVGARVYTSSTGRAYIFYNDGSIPTTAATADVTITGETTNNYFGIAMTAGDWNADGRTDLAIGAEGYSTNTGRAYIFYNDGLSFGTVACTTGCLASNADVTFTGETTSNYFGRSLMIGDFNSDGRIDLVGGARGYSTSTGRIYLFTSEAKVDSAPPATARVRGVGKLRGTSTLR